jgi:hypothetical protein
MLLSDDLVCIEQTRYAVCRFLGARLASLCPLAPSDEVLVPLAHSHHEIVGLRVAGHGVAEIAQKAGRANRPVERILQEFRQVLRDQIREPE